MVLGELAFLILAGSDALGAAMLIAAIVLLSIHALRRQGRKILLAGDLWEPSLDY
jgi:hypothetical protein